MGFRILSDTRLFLPSSTYVNSKIKGTYRYPKPFTMFFSMKSWTRSFSSWNKITVSPMILWNEPIGATLSRAGCLGEEIRQFWSWRACCKSGAFHNCWRRWSFSNISRYSIWIDGWPWLLPWTGKDSSYVWISSYSCGACIRCSSQASLVGQVPVGFVHFSLSDPCRPISRNLYDISTLGQKFFCDAAFEEDKIPLFDVKEGTWLVVSIVFYFHPCLGKWSKLANIFEMGWNHQLGTDGWGWELAFGNEKTLKFDFHSVTKTLKKMILPTTVWTAKFPIILKRSSRGRPQKISESVGVHNSIGVKQTIYK